jgi:hypothetical protein
VSFKVTGAAGFAAALVPVVAGFFAVVEEAVAGFFAVDVAGLVAVEVWATAVAARDKVSRSAIGGFMVQTWYNMEPGAMEQRSAIGSGISSQ